MSISKTMLWLCLAMAGVVVLSGCRGCNNEPLVERDKKLDDEKKKKPEDDPKELKAAAEAKHAMPEKSS